MTVPHCSALPSLLYTRARPQIERGISDDGFVLSMISSILRETGRRLKNAADGNVMSHRHRLNSSKAAAAEASRSHSLLSSTKMASLARIASPLFEGATKINKRHEDGLWAPLASKEGSDKFGQITHALKVGCIWTNKCVRETLYSSLLRASQAMC